MKRKGKMEEGLGREGSLYVCHVCFGIKNSKVVLFRSIIISLEKSVSTWQFPVNKVIKLGPCWEAPYLWLVMYWQLTLSDLFRKWWVEYKNTGSYCRRSLLSSPLSRFSPSPLPPNPIPLPFLRLQGRLINVDKALKRKVFREGIPSQNLPGGRRLSTLANKNQRTHQLGN